MHSRLFRLFSGAALAAAMGSASWAEVKSTHLTLDRPALESARLFAAQAGDGRVSGWAIVEAPHTFTAVAFLAEASSDGRMFVRVSADGRDWSVERELPDEAANDALDERGRAHPFALDRVSALYFPAAPARFVAFQYRGASRAPARVTAHFIDAGAAALRVQSEAGDPAGHPLKPPLVRRAEWGARPPRYAYTLTLARHLAIHHTAGVADGQAATREQCAAEVRAIQAFHQDSRGWNDIGYSYLVCSTGDVFQGREDDDDATDIWGAHDGFNDGSMSVSLLGYYHPPYNQVPSPAMMEALAATLAWMAAIRDVDPWGESLYPAFGAVRTNIYGHREVRATDCPGDIVFAIKDVIRALVAERLAALTSQTTPLRRP